MKVQFRSRITMAALMVGTLIGVERSHADTINFEGFSEGTVLASQYAGDGVDFGGTAVVLDLPRYNFLGYPPHSGIGVIYSPLDGAITISDTLGTWSSASIWAATDDQPVSLDAYNVNKLLLTSASVITSYGAPEARITVAAPGIAYVVLHGQANFFVADDFSFQSFAPDLQPPDIAAPLPSAARGGLVVLGLLGIARMRRITG